MSRAAVSVTWEKSARKEFAGFRFAWLVFGYLSSPETSRHPCVGAGALSPEKGGALRKQSTQGRRLGVAAVLCGGVLVGPLLLLQLGSAHAPRVAAAA